ncbi:protein Shroom, partial [Musca vetustissima]|uniref:protein Shroom n=1 Tax=Musca vetustissima TaxID=27455 RepID=UPI002AB70C84
LSRCNSKASYLPRQSLEKQASSDPDHGSYKLTLHSNEDLVGGANSNAKSTYDIMAQTQTQSTKLPSNLPDVLPLGAKLQPTQAEASILRTQSSSLRYGSNNNIATSPTNTQGQPQSLNSNNNCYPAYPPSQQRYSTPVLSSFNLNNNFSRSQSYDTQGSVPAGQSPTKYMTQSSLDLKKPTLMATTIEEHPNSMLESTSLKENQNSSLSSLSSLSESCASHEERLNTSGSGSLLSNTSLNNSSNSYHHQHESSASSACSSAASLFRAELVNTTLNGSATQNSNNNKKAVIRQESLRENIEKISQLQSQLMSAHNTENNGLLGHGYTSSLSPHINANRSAQANVIDIPKTMELNASQMMEDKMCRESTPPPSPPSGSPPTTPALSSSSLQEESADKTNETCKEDCEDIKSNNNEIEQEKALKESKNKTEAATTTEHILSQLDSSTDSLKMVQRSEIILRVNPNTVETASQTDDITDSELKSLTDMNNSKDSGDTTTGNRTTTTLQPRQRLPIEDECEKLSKELATMLPSNDSLIHLLCPPGSKTVHDYVSNLYNPNVRQRPSKRDVGTSTLTRQHHHNKTRDEDNKLTVELKLTEIEIAADSCDILKNKVDELIKYLNNKVRILSKEQAAIDEESAANDDLGNSLLNQLCDKVRPIEESKCRTYISDIGHITGLLLSLSERLARAENQLTAVGDNNTEKKSLENKRDRLLEQLTEAKRLKADIDRRGVSVKTLLEKNLTSDEYADFDYFINMKAKLITDSRDIADKIKMGEEIIAALSDTLIQSDC